uniref:Uncharacterized protein n=1 Tax=Mycena chlorophos TaxID=658473 RepID=A0ABQ0LW66_MYCCL|nr:predicted protein [Mycena chlorophos]
MTTRGRRTNDPAALTLYDLALAPSTADILKRRTPHVFVSSNGRQKKHAEARLDFSHAYSSYRCRAGSPLNPKAVENGARRTKDWHAAVINGSAPWTESSRLLRTLLTDIPSQVFEFQLLNRWHEEARKIIDRDARRHFRERKKKKAEERRKAEVRRRKAARDAEMEKRVAQAWAAVLGLAWLPVSVPAQLAAYLMRDRGSDSSRDSSTRSKSRVRRVRRRRSTRMFFAESRRTRDLELELEVATQLADLTGQIKWLVAQMSTLFFSVLLALLRMFWLGASPRASQIVASSPEFSESGRIEQHGLPVSPTRGRK